MLYKDDYDFQEFWNMNQFGPLNLLPASDFSQNHLLKHLWSHSSMKKFNWLPIAYGTKSKHLSRDSGVPWATPECIAFAIINFPYCTHKAWYTCVCVCVGSYYTTHSERDTIFTYNIVLKSTIYFPKEAIFNYILYS